MKKTFSPRASLMGRCSAIALAATGLSQAGLANSATAAAEQPLHEELETIVVSSPYQERTVGETILGVTVMSRDEILRQLDGSIGQTLARQPGISSTFFGPGASRPVIRGLGGDRVRVLDNGIGSIDASATSVDHAVAVEPAIAERIEILRGTAMLQYGSSAAGGIVNVIDGRIATQRPEQAVSGTARYSYSTVDEGNEIAGGLTLSLNPESDTGLVLYIDGAYRDTNDYDIPGFAESNRLMALEAMEEDEDHHDEDEDHDEDEHGHEEEEEVFGTVENSAVETYTGSFGSSYIFENGYFGVSVRFLDSLYGVPAAHEHGHEGEEDEEHEGEEHGEEEEENIFIDLEQVRIDVAGELRGDWGLFKAARMRFGYADYEHQELEGDEIGTLFSNEGWEGRFELVEDLGENWQGTSGVHLRSRDFSAVGEEAFVPPTDMTQVGFFTVKEYRTDNWHVDFGGRFESTVYEGDDIPDRGSFTNVSLSAGAAYDFNEAVRFGVSAFSTSRAPSAEELFSNGPHLATQAFEIGDPNLSSEDALGFEAALTIQMDNFTARLNAYVTDYDGFIYETPTGGEEDELPIFQFFQRDATFTGFEAQAQWHAGEFETDFGDIDVDFDVQADYVRAELSGAGDNPLPRIPPFSGLVGVDVTHEIIEFRTELNFVSEQNRVADFEIPTDDYTLWNAYLTIRPFKNKGLAFDVRAMNIADVNARTHTSFLKDTVPLPGQNFRFSFIADF